MMRYRFLVESKPVAGREKEYHAWYDGRHSTDLLRLPGATKVERFGVLDGGLDGPFFAIVDYETDDLPGLLETIKARSRTADMPSSEAIDRDSVKMTILQHWDPSAAE